MKTKYKKLIGTYSIYVIFFVLMNIWFDKLVFGPWYITCSFMVVFIFLVYVCHKILTFYDNMVVE